MGLSIDAAMPDGRAGLAAMIREVGLDLPA